MAPSTDDHHSYWKGDFDVQTLTIIITCSVAICNAFELLVWIVATFDRARGLYFWSLLIATLGLLPYTVGVILQYFRFTSDAGGMVLTGLGWSAAITGQSLVLYSRLAFVLNNKKILKTVKWMIIVNGVTWHTSTQAVHFCARYGPDLTKAHCSLSYSIVEKIQMTVFCIQEFAISGIYMWQTARLMNTLQKYKTRKVMRELFLVNLFIIALDIVLLTMEYLNFWALEVAIKGFVYSSKLKVEFLILGKLVDLVRASTRRTANNQLRCYGNGGRLDPNASTGYEGSSMPKWLCQADERDHGTMCNGMDGHATEPSLSWSAGMTVEERRRRQLTKSDPYAAALRSMSAKAESNGCPV